MITVALIGCSKKKRVPSNDSIWMPARELYTSDLFCKRVNHVESRDLPWYILSAKNGILKPTSHVRHYNQVITDLNEIEQASWHLSVACQLIDALDEDHRVSKLSDVMVEIHAGRKYCEPLATILQTVCLGVIKPVESLGIGEQLRYYASKSVRVHDETKSETK